MECRQMVNKNQ